MSILISLFLGFMLEQASVEDLSLRQAVKLAVSTHPSADSARSALRAAAERIPEAKAGLRPRVDYQENWVRSNNPVFVFGSLLTQRQFTASNFGLDSLNRPDFLNNFQSLISAEQPIWDAGRTQKAIEIAESQRQSAAVSVRQVELALASRTARAYLDALLTAAAIPVAEQAIESAQADLRQAEAVRDSGRSTAADALSMRVHLAAMREQLVMRRAEAKIAQSVLGELVGAPEKTTFTLTTQLESSVKTTPEGTSERPELELKRLELSAARSHVALAKLAWMPQVGLRVGFEADRQRLVTRAGSNWMAGVTLRWTPYQGGADRARLRMAQAMVASVQADEKATQQRVRLEVVEAETFLEASLARAETAQSAIASAEESLRITKDRYEAGLGNLTDLLRTETALTESKLRLLAARHGMRVAQLNHAAALGKLSPDSEVLQ